MTTEPKYIPDMDPRKYHAPQDTKDYGKFVVSKSMLWEFAKNPEIWLQSKRKESTAAMMHGSLVDCLALTPNRFNQCYRLTPATYPAKARGGKIEDKPWNWNANACKEWRDNLPEGVEAVTQQAMNDARAAERSLLEDDEWERLMTGSTTQAGCFASADAGGGLSCPVRALIDIVPHKDGPYGDALADFKTTAVLDNERKLRFHILDQGWHVQAALYRDIYHAVTGEWRPRFFFAMQRSEHPWDVYIKEMDQPSMTSGRNTYRNILQDWGRFLKTGTARNPMRDMDSIGVPEFAL